MNHQPVIPFVVWLFVAFDVFMHAMTGDLIWHVAALGSLAVAVIQWRITRALTEGPR